MTQRVDQANGLCRRVKVDSWSRSAALALQGASAAVGYVWGSIFDHGVLGFFRAEANSTVYGSAE
jgi:hypothetical protein